MNVIEKNKSGFGAYQKVCSSQLLARESLPKTLGFEQRPERSEEISYGDF
jgi:hypothetical protein